MDDILNITNGDSAVAIMQKAGIPGVLLPWRDVLHDGPVPGGLSLEALSEVRAEFITGNDWGEAQAIRQSFTERHNTLKSFAKFAKTVLWFEHDLYDQLQILQILDWFHHHGANDPELSMICVDRYLGMLTPDEMKALQEYEQPVTEAQLQLASTAWAAFRSTTPEKWAALLQTDTTALPFLEGAILRQLEEYPDAVTGLSRTARQALQIILDGEQRPGRVFGRYQESEQRRFMGDASFWVILHELLASSPPLLKLPAGKRLTLPTSPDQALSVTPAGEQVLAGERNWLDITTLDRWIGGVHLTPDNTWCWDSASGTVVKRS